MTMTNTIGALGERIFDAGEKCPVACTLCDGTHCWLPGASDDDDPPPAQRAGYEWWYACRHCPAWTPDDVEELSERMDRSLGTDD
jgi:hypothetical protein